MVKVTVYNNKNGEMIGVKCIGHAGYADAGSDIVCAAVSVLMFNTMNSIEKLTEDTFSHIVSEEKTLIDFKLDKKPGREALLLVESLVLGLEGILLDYGKKFIRIDSKEV